MFSAGKLTSALLGVSLTAALVAAPYRFTFTDPSRGLLPQTAAAQDDSEGSDSGSGEDSPSSDGPGSATDTEGTPGPSDTVQEPGGSGDPAAAGDAVQGSPDEEVEQGSTEPEPVDSTAPVDSGSTDQVEPDQQEPTDGTTANVPTEEVPTEEVDLEVQYSNGMREEIRDGRYEMTDAHGRIIINRPATQSDHLRLRAVGK
ncbi:hypothetical protein [Chelativorans xinjiangense]|uniref:hypothetical protein n=1 Tax=Chelativorans xinjiangense TaxID=2681485 RepID=UPI00135761D5|nr:hypothetical protein [Chelativorans xinjiangense]